MTNEEELAHHYIKFTTTSILEQDIKTIKRINTCLSKYYRTTRPVYLDEVKNIIITLSNTICIERAIDNIMVYIEDQYIEVIRTILEEDFI
jgi:hypothetical protein